MNMKKFSLFVTGMSLMLGMAACSNAGSADQYYEDDYETVYEDEYADENADVYEDDYSDEYAEEDTTEYETEDENGDVTEPVISELDSSLEGKSVGDKIALGTFEQDNNENNGAEPIEWMILSMEDDKALIISNDVLDYMPFNVDGGIDAEWDSSSLKKWLNTDFYDNAFSDSEKIRISSSEAGTVFILNSEEADKYFGDYDLQSDSEKYGYKIGFLCSPSAYAMRRRVSYWQIADEYNDIDSLYNLEGKHNLTMNDVYGDKLKDMDGKILAPWWLRDETGTFYGIFVGSDGLLSEDENTLSADDDRHAGVRPAMYITY